MDEVGTHRNATSRAPGQHRRRGALAALCVALLPVAASAYVGPGANLETRFPGLTREQVRSALSMRVESMRARNRAHHQLDGARARAHGGGTQAPAPLPRNPQQRPGDDLLH